MGNGGSLPTTRVQLQRIPYNNRNVHPNQRYVLQQNLTLGRRLPHRFARLHPLPKAMVFYFRPNGNGNRFPRRLLMTTHLLRDTSVGGFIRYFQRDNILTKTGRDNLILIQIRLRGLLCLPRRNKGLFRYANTTNHQRRVSNLRPLRLLFRRLRDTFGTKLYNNVHRRRRVPISTNNRRRNTVQRGIPRRVTRRVTLRQIRPTLRSGIRRRCTTPLSTRLIRRLPNTTTTRHYPTRRRIARRLLPNMKLRRTNFYFRFFKTNVLNTNLFRLNGHFIRRQSRLTLVTKLRSVIPRTRLRNLANGLMITMTKRRRGNRIQMLLLYFTSRLGTIRRQRLGIRGNGVQLMFYGLFRALNAITHYTRRLRFVNVPQSRLYRALTLSLLVIRSRRHVRGSLSFFICSVAVAVVCFLVVYGPYPRVYSAYTGGIILLRGRYQVYANATNGGIMFCDRDGPTTYDILSPKYTNGYPGFFT